MARETRPTGETPPLSRADIEKDPLPSRDLWVNLIRRSVANFSEEQIQRIADLCVAIS